MGFVGHQVQLKTLRQELEGRRRLSARSELGRGLHHKSPLLGGGMKEYSVNLSESYCSCQYFSRA